MTSIPEPAGDLVFPFIFQQCPNPDKSLMDLLLLGGVVLPGPGLDIDRAVAPDKPQDQVT